MLDALSTDPCLGGYSGDVFLAAFADGSVRALPASRPFEQLRGYATRDGGESVDRPRQSPQAPASLTR